MHDDQNFGIDPAAVYRVTEHGKRLFGLAHSQLHDQIEAGKIPKPHLVAEGGRATGWFGFQIIAHRRERLTAAAESTAK
jgi:hypothetical protein